MAAVQVFPFVYAVLFILLYGSYSFITNETIRFVIDYSFFVSPIVVFAHYIYSRMLRMCVWHRIACLLPVLTQIVDVLDTFVVSISRNGMTITVVTIIVSMIIYGFAIYGTFFSTDGRNYNRCIRVVCGKTQKA